MWYDLAELLHKAKDLGGNSLFEAAKISLPVSEQESFGSDEASIWGNIPDHLPLLEIDNLVTLLQNSFNANNADGNNFI